MIDENPHFWLNIKLPTVSKQNDSATTRSSHTTQFSPLDNLLKELHSDCIFTNNRWITGINPRKLEKKVRFLILEVEEDLPYCRLKKYSLEGFQHSARKGHLHSAICRNFRGKEEMDARMWLYRYRIIEKSI